MIEVIISFIWICLHCMICGSILAYIISAFTKYNRISIDLTLTLGLVFVTTYAQLFSVFYRVGTIAIIFLIVIEVCSIGIIEFQNKKKRLEHSIFEYIRLNIFVDNEYVLMRLASAVFLLFIVAIVTSSAPTNYDTSLYHAESIHMIEEYGIIKGAGNLHKRLAYNSSMFPFQALFSMAPMLGKSLHTANGFITWFVLAYAVCSMRIWKKKLACSDLLRLTIIYMNSSWVALDGLSSMQTDTFMNNLAAFIIVRWITLLEDKEDSFVPYALLSILAAFNLTVKLSSVFLVLLAIKPAISLIREKNIKAIVWCIFAGLVVVCPFIIRNIIISGYVLYPFKAIDLFNVPWKIPIELVEYEPYEIAYWARSMDGSGLPIVGKYTIFEWLPHYFEEQYFTDKCILIMDALFLPVCLLRSIYLSIKRKWDKALLYLTVFCCFMAWFMQAPGTRFGKVWMLFVVSITVAECMIWLFDKLNIKYELVIQRVVVAIVCLVLLKPSVGFVKSNQNWLKQADYEVFECTTYEVDGVDIYVPVEGDRAGYHCFPASTGINENVGIFEHGNIKSGFYYKE